jgi:hypothetical protein
MINISCQCQVQVASHALLASRELQAAEVPPNLIRAIVSARHLYKQHICHLFFSHVPSAPNRILSFDLCAYSRINGHKWH